MGRIGLAIQCHGHPSLKLPSCKQASGASSIEAALLHSSIDRGMPIIFHFRPPTHLRFHGRHLTCPNQQSHPTPFLPPPHTRPFPLAPLLHPTRLPPIHPLAPYPRPRDAPASRQTHRAAHSERFRSGCPRCATEKRNKWGRCEGV